MSDYWKDLNKISRLEESLYQKLLDNGFIFSNKVRPGACYIMNDGKFLSIEDNKDILGLDSNDIACHPQLDVFVLENNLIPEGSLVNRVLCETDNAIRVNDGSNLKEETVIGLPEKEPTSSQYNSLIDWLYDLMLKRTFVNVGDEINSKVFKRYDLKETFPEDIVKKIKAYYKDGRLRESEEIAKLIDID